MWATLDLLVRREARGCDLSENVEEWLETVNRRIAASTDDDKGMQKGRKKKRKGKNEKVEEKEEDISKDLTTSNDSPNNDKESNHCHQDGDVVGEESDSKNCVRTWNPRKGKRGHDRDIRKRLEQLMGSSVVNITDRKYMLELQQRIVEMHYENTEKRMANRMNEEVEREKRLVLENKMPMTEGSGDLSKHPVFEVQNRFEKNPRIALLRGDLARKKSFKNLDNIEEVIKKQEDQERRMDMGSRGDSKKKGLRVKVCSTREGAKDEIAHGEHTKESEESKSEFSGLGPVSANASMKVLLDLSEFRAREEEHTSGMKEQVKKLFEGPEGNLTSPSTDGDYLDEIEWEEDFNSDNLLLVGDEGSANTLQMSSSLEDEENKGYMLPESKFEALKYESPLIKELRRAKTVDELYSLADQIVGPVPDYPTK